MKVTAKVRRVAIEALDLAACNALDTESLSMFLPIQGPVHRLVYAAWCEVPDFDNASLAEAACLLRDGWSPGEPTIRLGAEP